MSANHDGAKPAADGIDLEALRQTVERGYPRVTDAHKIAEDATSCSECIGNINTTTNLEMGHPTRESSLQLHTSSTNPFVDLAAGAEHWLGYIMYD